MNVFCPLDDTWNGPAKYVFCIKGVLGGGNAHWPPKYAIGRWANKRCSSTIRWVSALCQLFHLYAQTLIHDSQDEVSRYGPRSAIGKFGIPSMTTEQETQAEDDQWSCYNHLADWSELWYNNNNIFQMPTTHASRVTRSTSWVSTTASHCTAATDLDRQEDSASWSSAIEPSERCKERPIE